MNRLHGKFAPNADADLAEEDDPRPILKLKAELALHRATRPKNHYRDGCAACRLFAWLDGEGQYSADNLSHSRVPRNLA